MRQKNRLYINKSHMITYGNYQTNWVHYILMLIFKFGMEYSYMVYLHKSPQIYPLDVNPVKYIYGLVWLTVLFFFLNDGRKKVSAFMLQFFYALQMVPLTVIYSLQNESTIYYSVICFSVLLCELLVGNSKDICLQINLEKKFTKKSIITFFFLICFLFILNVYRTNGLPTLKALDLYAVYELRSSGLYRISKYGHYLQDMIIKVLIPILLTRFLLKKQYFYLLIILGIEGCIYLYVGQKSYLFTGVMVIGTFFFLSRKRISGYFWSVFYSSFALISFLVKLHPLLTTVYSLIIRRIFLVSANNKFMYYDFFSTHPKEGFAGIFPRWLVPIKSNYMSGYPGGYTFQIGRIYYDMPEMDCNTGFLAEGYLRWGLIGIVFELLVFAFLLKCLDGFQRKAGFLFAAGTSIVMIFGLGDGYLISPLLCGYLTVWFLFLLFYHEKDTAVHRQDGRFEGTRLRLKNYINKN